ncbi:hypothetical protein C7212DRAFT_336194 [Tuber magnatum]|uniref:Large ribosomal subunit protein bL32m n=1 Tax=Tuber magnatum TaxID=42249 RepID=A0A317SD35_9PEZI|nr:hypothetical protein C7212DRAFT_336194 [Tuber magnatum]
MATPLLSVTRLCLLHPTRSLLPILRLPTLAIPAAIHLNIPNLLPGIWESILRAVPKKKQSHSRKRMRQLAGKALLDITALVKCPACGKIKRSNMLCEPCVNDIKSMWKEEAVEEAATKEGRPTTSP